ncbi:MAG: DUF1289 domain-containing protein [Coraliomargarita sp.]
MTRPPQHRNDVAPSPCNDQCLLDANDRCTGCFRTIDEITDWTRKSTEHKLAILQRCKERSSSAHNTSER